MTFNFKLDLMSGQGFWPATADDMQKNIDAFDRMLRTRQVGGDFVALVDVRAILIEMQRQMRAGEV
jgi:hypothetical protein